MAVEEKTRRSFLNTLLGIGGAAWAGSVVYPALMFLQPPEKSESSDYSATLEEKFSEMKPGDWSIFRFGDKPGLWICTLDGDEKKIIAFSATCTHLNCIVEFQPENKVIFCPCHNGSFDINGNNIAGPPPKPLEKFAVQITDDVIKILKES